MIRVRATLAVASALIVTGARAQEIPTTRVRNCTEAGCHASEIAAPVLHGPTAIGGCDSCHVYNSPEQHTFTMKRGGADLCVFCHIGSDTHPGAAAHQPFEDRDCIGCHDPHGSFDDRFLLGGSVAGLCETCHTGAIDGDHLHDPVGDDGCLNCHGAHGGEHTGLLAVPSGPELCATCHEQTRELIGGFSHPHQPAVDECAACHDPHASDLAHLLTESPRALCVSCHEDIAERALGADVKHSATLIDSACLNCHQAHGSDHTGMMHDEPVVTCLTCHAKEIKTEDERTIHAMSEIEGDGMHLHGALAVGECTGCHDPHGGDHRALLSADYTYGLYAEWDDEPYALCFQCHAPTLAGGLNTTTDTDFRDGDLNLHYTHVRGLERGRTCNTCHTPHAGLSRMLIAERVTFGIWDMPINYMPTETGGSCNSGCHRPAFYDRETPAGGIIPPDTED